MSLYHEEYCAADWIVIGKAYGFSGVICNMDHVMAPLEKDGAVCFNGQMHSPNGNMSFSNGNKATPSPVGNDRPRQPTSHQQQGGVYRNHPMTLNGFLTSTISPADLLRVVHTLAAVNSRGLLGNAVRSGRKLRRYLRGEGMDVWGWGLMIWFDQATGEPANALTSFARALPPLTFGSTGGEEWKEVVVVAGEFATQITEITMLHALSFRTAADMNTDLFLADWAKGRAARGAVE
jgi:hypothetical protein